MRAIATLTKLPTHAPTTNTMKSQSRTSMVSLFYRVEVELQHSGGASALEALYPVRSPTLAFLAEPLQKPLFFRVLRPRHLRQNACIGHSVGEVHPCTDPAPNRGRVDSPCPPLSRTRRRHGLPFTANCFAGGYRHGCGGDSRPRPG